MSSVQIPSIRLDDVRLDHADATQGTVTSGNTETFVLADSQTLTVAVDGGGAQTVTFYAVDFDNIALAAAQEIADVITAQLSGAIGTAETTGEVTITSATYGTSSSIQVTGGTANTELGFSTSIQSGLDAGTALLVNRIPEPDEVGYPVDWDISLDIVSGTGTAIVVGQISVYVGGDLAYDGAGTGFQTGFTGVNSAVSNPDVATTRIVIDPNSDLDPSTDYDVRVVIGSPAIDETYTFTTVDTVAPEITTVLAVSKKAILVIFNEAMKMVSATASDDALNPSNWTIDRNPPENTPAVNVVVESVEAYSSTVVVLYTDIELTFGIEYLLTLENAEDVNDNVINPATATDVAFDAYSPDYPDGRRFFLWDMIPEFNRAEDDTGDLARTLAVFQEVVNVLLSEMDDFPLILDPDTAPEPFLDAMLQDLGNPFSFVSLSVNDKRKLIQTLVPIYKLKGTEPGIVNTIQFLLGVTVTLNVFNTGTAFVLADGDLTQARLVSANAETYALTDGWTLVVRVDDTTNTTVTFNTADFAAIGAATAQEVADVITGDVSGVTAGATTDGYVVIQRDSYGEGTAVQVLGGTANGALGFSTVAERAEGFDHSSVSELGDSSFLAPGTSRQRYTYEIISPVALTADQREKMEQIATYMHPAHCHLLRIVEPDTDAPLDHLVLGMSALGGTASPGTWTLH